MIGLGERLFGDIAGQSNIGKQIYTFRRDPFATLAIVVIAVAVLGAVFAPVLAPYPDQGRGVPDILSKFQAPGRDHLFGTDDVGRDVLSRILYGGRVSISMGILVVFLSVLIGLPLGAVAGFYGGWIDEIIMRITDVFMAFPPLLLAIAISLTLERSFVSNLVAITVTWWPWYARLARRLALSVQERQYIDAARCMGINDRVIIVRHVVPNIAGPVLVQATMDIGLVILTAAGLSFIGLGVPPPQADWGEMVSAGRLFIFQQWWYAVFPGMAILLVVLAFNLLGDTLYEQTSPYANGEQT